MSKRGMHPLLMDCNRPKSQKNQTGHQLSLVDSDLASAQYKRFVRDEMTD